MCNQISFAEFKERVHADIQSGQWLFRGQACTSWGLVSSFHRLILRENMAFDLSAFAAMLSDFISASSDYLQKDLAGASLSRLAAMAQHHGVPTPLLDWTESPYIACYFGAAGRLREQNRAPFRVWAFNPGGLEAKTDIPEFAQISRQLFVLRTKQYDSVRLHRQLGVFTFHGFEESDLQAYLANEVTADTYRLHCYDIRCDKPWEILRELRLMGLTGSTLFDSLDGFALDVEANFLANGQSPCLSADR